MNKHAGGRPPKYTKVEEMQEKIDEYFLQCDIDNEPYTVTGLGLALGMSRQDLINYRKKDEFFDTIKKAKMKVEEYCEVLLKDGRSACIVEILSDKDFLADVGDSPEDWENIYITINDIDKIIK